MGVRPGCSSILEGANFLGKGFDLFAKRIDGRPVVFVNLIDHLDHDHILLVRSGSPNFLVLVYLVEKVHEISTWRGVSQVSLINVWEACYCVASGSLKPGGALPHENWGQGRGAILSRGAPSTRGWWGRSAALPFPLPRRREPNGWTAGSMWYSCNLTDHATQKS